MLALRRRGVVPDTDKGARADVIWAVTAGVVGVRRPWEAKARERQAKIRARYLDHAKELERTGKKSDWALAVKVREFVARMPDPETRREHLMRELVAAAMRKRPDRARGEAKRKPGEGRGER